MTGPSHLAVFVRSDTRKMESDISKYRSSERDPGSPIPGPQMREHSERLWHGVVSPRLGADLGSEARQEGQEILPSLSEEIVLSVPSKASHKRPLAEDITAVHVHMPEKKKRMAEEEEEEPGVWHPLSQEELIKLLGHIDFSIDDLVFEPVAIAWNVPKDEFDLYTDKYRVTLLSRPLDQDRSNIRWNSMGNRSGTE